MDMDGLAKLQHVLGWCSLVHILMLSFWFLVYRFLRDPLRQLQGFFVPAMNDEAMFDRIMLYAFTFYKMAALVFFIIPYLVLRFG